jgi:transposase
MSTLRSDLEILQEKYELLRPFLDERQRRLWAATEARTRGWGGITLVSQATHLHRQTIRMGIQELQTLTGEAPSAGEGSFIAERGMEGTAETASEGKEEVEEGKFDPARGAREVREGRGETVLLPERRRRPGGGRKPLTQKDPTLLRDLERLVEPLTRGDPESPLRWTCKSTTNLAEELHRQGHSISVSKVGELLHQLGYSLQSTRKSHEGSTSPDRNAQFEHINAQAQAFRKRGQPVISVDAKKRELVGNYKNGGREWHPHGEPEAVEVYDFPDKTVGKATPYGVYDLARNEGWVSVGIDHNTAEFARSTIQTWWLRLGEEAYPDATDLLVIADGGGSNSSRSRVWKTEIQTLADRTGLSIGVCHFPPGMSKWNMIEHRMFCQISGNWRGRPLVSHEVIVELIGNTRTRTGLHIEAELDRSRYDTGRKISDDELEQVRIEPHSFHGEWNYTIRPSLSST